MYLHLTVRTGMATAHNISLHGTAVARAQLLRQGLHVGQAVVACLADEDA